MARPTPRRGLGALFAFLSLAFVGIAIGAAGAGGRAWIVAATAAVLAFWLGSLALASFRRP